MGMTRRQSLGLLAGTGLSAWAPVARAQGEAYPDRPLRIVVPYAPGATNDLVARIVATKLSEQLGQVSVVVENRSGAQAIVGSEAVARAKPDGYTLLMGASGPMVFNPATYDRLPYDTLRDFAPVSLLVSFPLVLVVSAASPIRSVQELVAYAREEPGRATYGSPAASFQLATELFAKKVGATFRYVAYRGTADAVNAAAAQEVTMCLGDSAGVVGAVQGGRVRALAVTSAARLATLPDVPTLAELGIQGSEVELFTGLLAPSGTPVPIVQKLQAALATIMRQPDTRQRMDMLALTSVGSTAEEFSALIAREIDLWRTVAREANIRMER